MVGHSLGAAISLLNVVYLPLHIFDASFMFIGYSLPMGRQPRTRRLRRRGIPIGDTHQQQRGPGPDPSGHVPGICAPVRGGAHQGLGQVGKLPGAGQPEHAVHRRGDLGWQRE